MPIVSKMDLSAILGSSSFTVWRLHRRSSIIFVAFRSIISQLSDELIVESKAALVCSHEYSVTGEISSVVGDDTGSERDIGAVIWKDFVLQSSPSESDETKFTVPLIALKKE